MARCLDSRRNSSGEFPLSRIEVTLPLQPMKTSTTAITMIFLMLQVHMTTNVPHDCLVLIRIRLRHRRIIRIPLSLCCAASFSHLVLFRRFHRFQQHAPVEDEYTIAQIPPGTNAARAPPVPSDPWSLESLQLLSRPVSPPRPSTTLRTHPPSPRHSRINRSSPFRLVWHLSVISFSFQAVSPFSTAI